LHAVAVAVVARGLGLGQWVALAAVAMVVTAMVTGRAPTLAPTEQAAVAVAVNFQGMDQTAAPVSSLSVIKQTDQMGYLQHLLVVQKQLLENILYIPLQQVVHLPYLNNKPI
jgi:hypothetical protein